MPAAPAGLPTSTVPSQEDELQQKLLDKAKAAGFMDAQAYLDTLEKENRLTEIQGLLSGSDQVLLTAIRTGMADDFAYLKAGISTIVAGVAETKSIVTETNSEVKEVKVMLAAVLQGHLQPADKALAALPEDIRELFSLVSEESKCLTWSTFTEVVPHSVFDLEDRVASLQNVWAKTAEAEGVTASEFLERIVRHMLDGDGNGMISTLEMNVFVLKCKSFYNRAERMGLQVTVYDSDPKYGLAWLLTVLRQTFNPADWDKERAKNIIELERLLRPLRFKSDVETLSVNFLEGSREWLIREADAWIAAPSSRAFVMLGAHGVHFILSCFHSTCTAK